MISHPVPCFSSFPCSKIVSASFQIFQNHTHQIAPKTPHKSPIFRPKQPQTPPKTHFFPPFRTNISKYSLYLRTYILSIPSSARVIRTFCVKDPCEACSLRSVSLLIVSVGYRVSSVRATQFRQWSTSVLRQFAIRGYVLDRKRMENGAFLSEDYFDHLLAEIREIRLSERNLYKKLTDIYATSMDYNKDAPTTREFYIWSSAPRSLHPET